MNEIYLLTGGNIGDRMYHLQQACDLLEKTVGSILKRSLVYETAAWGLTDQEAFLNQVLQVDAECSPGELLDQILGIELQLGRKRLQKMGPRVIDIDILFYGRQVVSTPELVVPHPRMAERRFVLTPLNEIAPDFVHPIFNKTIHQLLRECADPLTVNAFGLGR